MPEGSFVDESGRVVGRGGLSPLGAFGPRLDARLVAVFSPRSMPASTAGMHTQPVRLPATCKLADVLSLESSILV